MHNEHDSQLIKRVGAQKIIDKLQPFVTPNRQDRIKKVLDSRISTIELAIEAPSDINNALAALRSSEVFGISTVHIIAAEGTAGSVKLITQGACYWVEVKYHDSLQAFMAMAEEANLALAGGTVSAQTPLSEVPIEQPLCLMIGNEQRGLSPECVSQLDHPYTIPMHGMTESLNLSVSAAISLYDTTQRKRQWLKSNGDLTPTLYQNNQARYFMRSVNRRLLTHIDQLPTN